jgi:hypothetical protein
MSNTIDEVVSALGTLHRRQSRITGIINKTVNWMKATVRSELGWVAKEKGSADAADADKLKKTAGEIVDQLLDDKPPSVSLSEDALSDLAPAILIVGKYREGRGNIEKQMRKLFRKTPIAEWADHPDRNGAGELGLAMWVGAAGDFSKYKTKSALRKRLGHAPFTRTDGITRACSTWRYYGGLSEDEWSDDVESNYKGPGYQPKRRAIGYGYIQGRLLQAQWRSAEKHPSGEAGPIGPYGKLFGDYKKRQTERNEAGEFAELAKAIATSLRKKNKPVPKENLEGRLTGIHIHNRALRYMVQKLSDHAWAEWRRRASGCVPEEANAALPAVASPIPVKAGAAGQAAGARKGHTFVARRTKPRKAA